MLSLKKIAVIGGDQRCCVCADMFSDAGLECAVYGLENSSEGCCATKCTSLSDALCDCDVLILPVPVMRDSTSINAPLSEKRIHLSDILDHIEPKTLVFCGNPGKCFYTAFSSAEKHNEIINYAESGAFSVMSAVPTAEGAVAEAIGLTGKTIADSTILVCGYGRIGKYLSRLLHSMGANVHASARKWEDIEWIKAMGLTPLQTDKISQCNTSFDIIFNTVPSLIFNEAVLSSLKGSPVIIELASKPYGIDFEAAAELDIKTVIAGGLPGKKSPHTAGRIMFECICRNLNERGFDL